MFLYMHLATIFPSLILGAWILSRPKGGSAHRKLGRVWAILMLVSSTLSFGILSPLNTPHTWLGMSWLHGLAAFTIYSVIKGWRAAIRRDFNTHKRAMVESFIGSCIAFVFALSPGRLLGEWARQWLAY